MTHACGHGRAKPRRKRNSLLQTGPNVEIIVAGTIITAFAAKASFTLRISRLPSAQKAGRQTDVRYDAIRRSGIIERTI